MFKSILETHLILCEEWDYVKNGDLKPEDVSYGSNKKVWWKCKNNHSWKAAIHNRTKGKGCPYCAGKLPIKGETDLKTINPVLALEWNYEANEGLKPEEFTACSGKEVWWKCARNHSWKSKISNRANGKNCPYCSGRLSIVGENDLKFLSPLLISEWDYDRNKNINPCDFKIYSNTIVWWKCKYNHSWKAAISQRTTGSQCPYCTGNLTIVGETDLKTVNPILALEWDYDKNGNLKPEHVTTSSGKKVWWKCKQQHSWETTIAKRTNGSQCPYCIGKLPIVGETDLKTINPTLASEWDYKKNGDLNPEHITCGSAKKVWWKCIHNHSWEAIISSRFRGSQCPYCTGTLPIVGKTDLKTIHPTLVLEWDYDKNKELKPEQITACSGKKIWWKCKKHHSWQASVASRARGNACPYCSGRFSIIGENDLKTVKPILALEWDYENNEGLKPEHVSYGSKKHVWWRCEFNHSWKASIDNRIKGSGCPYCSGNLPILGETDLMTVNPMLAQEWDYEKNDNLTPNQVKCGSNKKVWWKCKNGHSWKACINSRNRGTRCPDCSYD